MARAKSLLLLCFSTMRSTLLRMTNSYLLRLLPLFLLVSLLVLPVAANAGVTVTLSSPASGSTVSGSATIKASASSGYPITAWHIYVDGRDVWGTSNNAQSIAPVISISSGTHNVVIRAWDTSGAYGSRSLTLTGSGSGTPAPSGSGLPIPPSTAKVFTNIEDRSFESCTACADDPNDPTPELAVFSKAQFQQMPSLSGSSTRFSVGGSVPYANALWWTKFGAQNSMRNFLWESWIYVKEDSYNAQVIEMDVWQSISKRKYMFGTQCNYIKGFWQGWDEPNLRWVDYTHVPCTKFPAGKWTQVVWYVKRTSDNKLNYVTLKVGDKVYNVNRYQNSGSTYWADNSGVQYQLDLNSKAADFSIWVDKVKLTVW